MSPRTSPLLTPGRLAHLLQLTAPRKSFGTVLAAIVVAVIFQLSVTETEATRVIGVMIQAGVAVIALRAAGARLRVLEGVGTVVVVLVALALLMVLVPGELSLIGPRLIGLLLISLTPLAIIGGLMRELREDGHVTIQTVYCGLCVYLLIGTGFAFLFGLIADVGGQPFFANGIPGTPNDYLYFSFATLTTTGYGDFAAATDVGRAASVTEALIGQMYLVTVVAVIVANVRRRHPANRS